MLKHLTKKLRDLSYGSRLSHPNFICLGFFSSVICFMIWGTSCLINCIHTHTQKKKKEEQIFGRQCNESSQIKSSIFTAGEGHREGTAHLWMPGGGASAGRNQQEVSYGRGRAESSVMLFGRSRHVRFFEWSDWLRLWLRSAETSFWTARSLKCKRFVAMGGAWLGRSVHQTEISHYLLDGLSSIFFRDPLIPDDGAKWNTGGPLTVPVVPPASILYICPDGLVLHFAQTGSERMKPNDSSWLFLQRQLFNELLWNLVQAFMCPLGWIILTSVNPKRLTPFTVIILDFGRFMTKYLQKDPHSHQPQLCLC